jgi:hypothetical protein
MGSKPIEERRYGSYLDYRRCKGERSAREVMVLGKVRSNIDSSDRVDIRSAIR